LFKQYVFQKLKQVMPLMFSSWCSRFQLLLLCRVFYFWHV